MTTKRDFRFGYALLGGSLGMFATTGVAAAAEQITFVSQGGAYQQAQTVAILDPSAKKLGITINQDSIPDAWPAIKTRSPRSAQRRSPPRAESCFATSSERPRRAAQYGTSVQFADPVTGSSGIPWRGAKNR